MTGVPKQGKPVDKNVENRNYNIRYLSKFIRSTRNLYIIIAIVLVCRGFYNAYEKLQFEDVSIRQEYRTSAQRRYPSITFCYKYQHGTKRVFENYFPKFYEEAKRKECNMMSIETKGEIIQNFTAIENANQCTEKCQNNANCSLWTFMDGMCYMKNEKSFNVRTNRIRLFSGIKDCEDMDCIMPGIDMYGGDMDAAPANNHEECQEMCNRRPDCRKWTYEYPDVGACYLRKSIEEDKTILANADVKFCYRCKTGFRNSKKERCSDIGAFDDLTLDFSSIIPDRTSFLNNFTQRFESETFGLDMLREDKNWNTFIPNENSGPCYTYNPPRDSNPGDINLMYMVFNFYEWDPLLEIFLHEKNDFYYSKRKMYNTILITKEMLDDTGTKYPRALVKIETQQKISTKRIGCNGDPNYSYYQCGENYYNKLRGCQYPWTATNESDLEVCSKHSKFSSLFWHWNQNIGNGAGRENFKLTELLLKYSDKCPPPCYLKKYQVSFERWAWYRGMNKTVSLQVALDGFTIPHLEEFFKCDTGCVVGELGGNLGFFLGGSILLILDIFFTGIKRMVEKRFVYVSSAWN